MNTTDFRNLAETIANLRPSLFVGSVTVDQVKIALVEHDIVPACILDGVGGDEPKQPAPEPTDDELDEALAELGDEADFLEDGSTPTGAAEFIDEEEDKNPSGVIRVIRPS